MRLLPLRFDEDEEEEEDDERGGDARLDHPGDGLLRLDLPEEPEEREETDERGLLSRSAGNSAGDSSATSS